MMKSCLNFGCASDQPAAGVGSDHPFDDNLRATADGRNVFFDLRQVAGEKLDELPFCLRILLENVVRNCDGYKVKTDDVNKILRWLDGAREEIPYQPSRVLLQDFTGVPAVVDLASMRDATVALGRDPKNVNPLVPVDLVIDHSVAVDTHGSTESLTLNEQAEFERNAERFKLLKWAQKSFQNFRIVPPGCGICHQINLEYLARGIMTRDGANTIYPDSVVGTDSHTTMIAGMAILGWGVGGIEAEAVMLGQPIYMLIPDVIGFEVSGSALPPGCTATDIVLKIANILRTEKVVGKFVEFYGEALERMSIADRALISNMSPEFGCTVAYFPYDARTADYFVATGRDKQMVKTMNEYFEKVGLYYTPDTVGKIRYSKVLKLNISTEVKPSIAGPKRPHDYNLLDDMATLFPQQLTAPNGFKGFGLTEEQVKTLKFDLGDGYELRNGSVVLAAITSCTNTSNASVMMGAGLLARKAVQRGLTVSKHIKCSLSPGSHVVQKYLEKSGLYDDLMKLGFFLCGFGCQSCIGNSGDLVPEVVEIANKNPEMVLAAVLSGNRNFEGRVNPLTKANYLASPLLVVAYALSGRVDIDWNAEPIQGNVYLKDIWPTAEEIEECIRANVTPEMFHAVYATILEGSPQWQALAVDSSVQYAWDAESTYVHKPPFFEGLKNEAPREATFEITGARCLLNLGDSITTDHISPAGKIALESPAARYLQGRGVAPRMFNSYGSRRGHDEVMVRGTFANIRLINKMSPKQGPFALHVPSGELTSVYEAAMKYEGTPLIILAGAEYGSGSSRDWAAKGTKLLGVRCVIAKSFERIHRSNLVGMGILPLQFKEGEDADTLGLSGRELYDVKLLNKTTAQVRTDTGTSFEAVCRIDTPVEFDYFAAGGILNYVLLSPTQD